MEAFNHLSHSLESTVIWILRNLPQPVDIGALVKQYSTHFRTLCGGLEKMLSPSAAASSDRLKASLQQQGIPAALCNQIATRVALQNGIDIVDLSLNSSRPVVVAGETYFGVSEALGLGWIHDQIAGLEVSNIWHERAKFSLMNELRNHQGEITARILGSGGAKKSGDSFTQWHQRNSAVIDSLAGMVKSLKQEPALDFSMLSVLVSELSQLR
jgi:glutamate dehydrogenase